MGANICVGVQWTWVTDISYAIIVFIGLFSVVHRSDWIEDGWAIILVIWYPVTIHVSFLRDSVIFPRSEWQAAWLIIWNATEEQVILHACNSEFSQRFFGFSDSAYGFGYLTHIKRFTASASTR
ncbi:MAG: hypothetical protein BWX66_01203 [Deltaproteobacteria bacterium ADurb.Bin058]|nr:MAG: hypothetical protein BWX66_01203 [Deltaproteobacteria bacterium ADurb.Bin058]